MSLINRIKKKIARRFRKKGTATKFSGKVTARDLWERNFTFSNPEPARAGTTRRIKREAAEAKARKRQYARYF